MDVNIEIGNTMQTTFRLLGRIVDMATGHGVLDVVVELWDHEGICQDLVAVAKTDALGDFTITLESTYLESLFLERTPSLSFRLFRDGQFAPPTATWKPSSEQSRVRIAVDLIATRTNNAPSSHVVRGRISSPSGTALSDRIVRAYDKGLNGSLLLGETTTDQEGRYRISYSAAMLGRAGKLHADLEVRAFESTTAPDSFADSAERCHAPTTALVDLVSNNALLRGENEVARVKRNIISVISDGSIANLNEDQISYIACTTKESRELIALFVKATNLAIDLDLGLVFYPEFMYLLLRQGLPDTLLGILVQKPATLRDAILRAMEQNIVEPATPAEIEALLAPVIEKMVNLALDPRPTSSVSLGGILGIVLTDPNERKSFVRAILDHNGSVEAFWTTLAEGTPVFAVPGTIDKLKRTLQLGALCRYHAPLVKELNKRFENATLTSMRDLAKYSESEWRLILDLVVGTEPPISCPTDTPGADEDAKRTTFARILARTVATAFPTAAIATRITAEEIPTDDVRIFFSNNPGLDLGSMRLASYLKKTSGAMTGVVNVPATTRRLKAIERLLRITPSYDEIKHLLAAGFESAQSIHRIGKRRFVVKVKAHFSTEKAEAMYARASWISSAAIALLGKYSSGTNGPLTYALPDLSTPADTPHADIADFAALFGTLDGCACEHCRSVYGPAAYLVDLLEFLDKHDSKLTKPDSTEENPKYYSTRDVLLGDLGGPPGGPVARRPDIARLMLSCENTNTALPYIDLVNEILEVCVANVAADPDQVLNEPIETTWTTAELLAEPKILYPDAHHIAYTELANSPYPFSLPFELWTEEARVYLDHLGVSRYELLEAFFAPKQNPPVGTNIDILIARERLRMSKREWEIVTNDAANAPTTAACWGMTEATWLTPISKVPRFLKQAGISFDELRELLSTNYVNPFGVSPVVTINPAVGCEIDTKDLVGLTEAILGRIHRFLRLRKRIGVAITTLDQLMTALGASDIDAEVLRKIVDIVVLAEKLALPMPVLASFWAALGTNSTEWGASIYETLFIDKSLGDTNPFVMLLQGPLSPAKTVLEHAAGVLSALRLNALDFAILAIPAVAHELIGTTSVLADGAQLSLDNLSQLHRHVALARALGLGIRDYRVLHTLANMNPLAGDSALPSTPADTRGFVALAEKVKRSTFTIAEIDYLIRHFVMPGASMGLSEDALTALVVEMDAAIAQIIVDAKTSPDPKTPTERALLREKNITAFVKQRLAAELKVDLATMGQLLEFTILAAPASSAPCITNFFLVSEPVGASPTSADRKQTIRRLEKAGLIVTRLNLGAAELEWLYQTNISPAWLNLNALLLTRDESDTEFTNRFTALMRLVDLASLRDTLPNGRDGLLAIFDKFAAVSDPASKDVFYNEVATQMGVPNADVVELIDVVFGYALTPVTAETTHLLAETALPCLARAITILGRLGASVKQVAFWTDAASALSDVALDIKRVARAKYEDGRWSEIARPLRNGLRAKQRDVLVGYLVAKYDVKGPDALFDLLLIDVEMSPCQLTSRIKLAISSVQTFVQRAFLRLEAPGIVLDEEAAQDWEWMKNYRVWEANRKVFLYPENWIEPELRDDKTPFFKALESRLLQGEINAETAEIAFRGYLESLHTVARLEIAAICSEKEEGEHPVDILHVIGRTAAAPHEYYYRRRVDSQYWTAWEKLELDIQGDHLLATVWNRRLHLFWPVFETRTVNNQEKTLINMAWSRLDSEGFSATKTTRSEQLYLGGQIDRRLLSFSVSHEGETLDIDCLVYLTGEHGVIQIGTFMLDPCTGNMESALGHGAEFHLWEPRGSVAHYMGLREWHGVNESPSQAEDHDRFAVPLTKPVFLLEKTPGLFFINIERTTQNVRKFSSPREKLFFSDRSRTFFLDLQTKYLPSWKNEVVAFPNIDVPIGAPMANDLDEIALGWAHEPKVDIDTGITIHGLYRFHNFYHPYVCDFVRRIERDGIDGLLKWSKQGTTPLQNAYAEIDTIYAPTHSVVEPFPVENVDFSFGGAYSQYNWELFFHAPFLIATRLFKNNRFEDADRWFRYIFDPTGGAPGNGAERFWYVRPFRENIDLASIQSQLAELSAENPNAEALQALFGAAFESGGTLDIAIQIAIWRDNPFNPHLIARMRPIAYQKAVVMKYVENLIAWGDSLFRRDTMESINEATQLYILAGQILGKRPQLLKERTFAPKTYKDLEPLIDAFSNALVEIESVTPLPPAANIQGTRREPPPALKTLYFCVPQNDKMLGLWDIVGDRLFKVRHCMNIDGTVRQLPLFEPPIDPALLVKAQAAGVDIGDLLSNGLAALPIYRFSVLHSKAMEFAGSVIAMGSALLSALEKRDGEALSLLRSKHEIDVLSAVREVRKRQVDEAKEALAAIQRSRDVVEKRWVFYRDIPNRIDEEVEHLNKSNVAKEKTKAAQYAHMSATLLRLIPQYEVGLWSLLPIAKVGFGGLQLGGIAEAVGEYFAQSASENSADAAMAATLGSYKRRADEWNQQRELAELELKQFDRQIAGAEIRLELAKKELANHELSTRNAKEVEEHLMRKYTSKELYDWFAAQVSAVYFQGYKLAYEMAKRAERAFQYELAQPTASYITFGYWESLKKGLLAGERLQLDLRRMEAAYLEQNKREFEMTKHISLAEVDPVALLKLRETGVCTLVLPEAVFDRDWPGHFMRRIKTVSMTVPVVNGPYVGVNAKLTQLEGHVRIKTTDGAYNPRTGSSDTEHFMHHLGAIETILTSSGQNDAGVFELVFRDERYLPFEGAGADSTWEIKIEKETNRFELSAIQDVVLHVRYTARDAGDTLTSAVGTYLDANAKALRLFSVKTDFPEAFHALSIASAPETISLPISLQHFQPLRGLKTLKITKVSVYARRSSLDTGVLKMSIGLPNVAAVNRDLTTAAIGALVRYESEPITVNILPETAAGFASWTLRPDVIEPLDDIWLVCEYTK